MKILELYIDGFGKFHQKKFALTDGINIIYGKNEAGKSTVHTFIRGMLFGIEKSRGRAAKNDLYSKYEPWENKNSYEGKMRVEDNGHIYRIERSFSKNSKMLKVIDETLGKEIEPSSSFFNELLSGLTETSYNNTISVGQLKSATEDGMISELKNYIANMNSTGNMALNVTKATAYLKEQRKKLDKHIIPEAARDYTALVAEIRDVEADIASPKYSNTLLQYQDLKSNVKAQILEKQNRREELLQKIARGQQLLEANQFSDKASIVQYSGDICETYKEHLSISKKAAKKTGTVFCSLFILLAVLSAAFAFYIATAKPDLKPYVIDSYTIFILCGVVFCICVLIALFIYNHKKRLQSLLNDSDTKLEAAFLKHIGDSSVNDEAMNAFSGRIEEFIKLCDIVDTSKSALAVQMDEIQVLTQQQNSYNDVIEEQQKNQWELEKKLDYLSSIKDRAEALKAVISENDRISTELCAIDLANETMTDLSSSIRNSFGLYLNKTASGLIDGITGGIYNSLSVNENLDIFLNTKTKLVPMEQVSSGTLDQLYLALRLATANLIQDKKPLPLILDDSFVLYDNERLNAALTWLSKTYKGQLIIFTCHTREADVLKSAGADFNYIAI